MTTITTKKTNADYQAAYRQKQADKGLVRLTGVWIHPDDIDKIRAMVKVMTRAREG